MSKEIKSRRSDSSDKSSNDGKPQSAPTSDAMRFLRPAEKKDQPDSPLSADSGRSDPFHLEKVAPQAHSKKDPFGGFKPSTRFRELQAERQAKDEEISFPSPLRSDAPPVPPKPPSLPPRSERRPLPARDTSSQPQGAPPSVDRNKPLPQGLPVAPNQSIPPPRPRRPEDRS